MPVNALDQTLVALVNGLAGRWPALDHFVLVVAGNHLVKGGVMVAFVWTTLACSRAFS